MTIQELDTILTNQNGAVTYEQAEDLLNTFFNEPTYTTETWYLSMWALSNKIDYVNIEPNFWKVLKKTVLAWLFSDDDNSDLIGEYDVVTKQVGDKLERNLRLNNDIPQALKNELLTDIGNQALRIESTKLQNAIDSI